LERSTGVRLGPAPEIGDRVAKGKQIDAALLGDFDEALVALDPVGVARRGFDCRVGRVGEGAHGVRERRGEEEARRVEPGGKYRNQKLN